MAKAAYIHIPFCSHKCDFCDFAAYAGLDDLRQEYCRVLEKEINERLSREENHESLSSIFFGGGTPGYIEPELLSLPLRALSERSGIDSDAEITLETTPQSVTKDKCRSWLSLGINRISIGIESLNENELSAMGRDHSRQEALSGVKMAQESGFENLALDLMYGLPEQTAESWGQTLDELLGLSPKHLSAYALTIAQNSPLLIRYPKDSKAYPNEEGFEQMYKLLVEKAREKGLVQYEISNFALPGYESRHNLVYWRNEEYLAFGVSAHRYYRGSRSSNFRALKRYMREYANDESSELIDKSLMRQEAIFLGLRLLKGINLAEHKRTYGQDLLEEKGRKIEELREVGLLELESGFLKLSQKGILVSNSVMAELI